MITIDEASTFIQNGRLVELRAALSKQPELAKTPTAMGVSLLQFAAYCGDQEAIEILRPLSEPINFYEAACIGAKDAIQTRLQADLELLNAPGPDGFTGLGLASFFGHQGIVEYLLGQSADPNVSAVNAIGVYPIHSACAVSNYSISELLLQAGANPNVAQQRNITPLHSVAHNGQERLVKLLLQYGADRAAVTTEGKMPADMAQEAGFSELGELLKF